MQCAEPKSITGTYYQTVKLYDLGTIVLEKRPLANFIFLEVTLE